MGEERVLLLVVFRGGEVVRRGEGMGRLFLLLVDVGNVICRVFIEWYFALYFNLNT